MGPPAEPGGPPAAKIAGNPRRMRVLTDLVHETRSVKKSIWGRFVRCFRPVHAVVSLPSHPGGSPPPFPRSLPRATPDVSSPYDRVCRHAARGDRRLPDGGHPGGNSMENAMQPHETSGENFLSLLRWRLIWAVVAGVVAATGWSWLMSWCAGFLRVSDVSLAAAAERGNTPSTWLATFVVAACAAFLLQCFVHSLISLLIRFCRRGPRRTGR